MKKWEIRGRRRVFENRIFTMNTLNCFHPEKGVSWDFHVIDTFNWINVIGLTDKDEFILVKQHRLGTDELSIETPGGVIEEGEDPETCAIREFIEETGYTGRSIHLLKTLRVNPAIMGNRISFFFIDGCVKTGTQDLDEAEDIEVLVIPVQRLIEMVRAGEIDHSIVLTGLGLYFLSEHNRFGTVML